LVLDLDECLCAFWGRVAIGWLEFPRLDEDPSLALFEVALFFLISTLRPCIPGAEH